MQSQLRVLILLPDESSLNQLDELLWTHLPTSFLPHCLASDANAAQTPILLSLTSQISLPTDLLINLTLNCPDNITTFTRILEVVSSDEQDSQAGRQRYKLYREQGYQLGHFDLAKTA